MIGPKILGHATDIIFAGVLGRQLPAGITKAAGGRGAAGAGQRQLRRPAARASDVVPGPGHRLRRARRRAAAGPSRSTSRRRCSRWLQGYLLNGVVQRTVLRLRADVEDKLNRLPLRYFDKQPRGELLSRVTNDIDNVSQTLQQTLSQLLTSLLTVVGVLVMMFVDLAAAGADRAGHAPAVDRRDHADRQARRRSSSSRSGSTPARSTRQIEEAFTGHELVKVFGRQREVEEQLRRARTTSCSQASFGAQFISGLIMPAMMFIGNLNYVLIAVVGGLRVASGSMSLGDVQAFIQYSRQFTQPLTQVASMANLLQSGVASAERVFELLDADEQEPDAGAAAGADRPARPGRVRARLVPLRARPAADRGPVAGRRARADGRDRRPDRRRQDHAGQPDHAVLRARRRPDHRSTASTSRRCAASELRGQIGMVLQDTWLFGGTIRDNIAYGRPDATEERDPRRRQGHLRRPLRALAARRLRHRDRRGGQQRQRGREAADHDRPGVPGRPGAADPRRGDQLGRHPHRGAGAARDGGAARGPHQLRDRAPAVDDPRRRPDPGDGGRPDRRAGHARGAARARGAYYRLTTPSSAVPWPTWRTSSRRAETLRGFGSQVPGR